MNERERIENIIASEGMTAKQFSEEVGIQAGTISNIMNGRNNPSLDVMQKILNRFRTIQSDWLILGIGSMYRQQGDQPVAATLFDEPTIEPVATDSLPHMATEQQQNNATAIPVLGKQPAVQEPFANRQIDRIVVFYTDATYETFTR